MVTSYSAFTVIGIREKIVIKIIKIASDNFISKNILDIKSSFDKFFILCYTIIKIYEKGFFNMKVSHKHIKYSMFPRIMSFLNKGFFFVDTKCFFTNGVYYNGHKVGIEDMNTCALKINWPKLYSIAGQDINIQ